MKYLRKSWLTLNEEGLSSLLIKVKNKSKKLARRGRGELRSYTSYTEKLSGYDKLQKPQPISLKTASNELPLVSIIVPVYNKSIYTYNCLKSIRDKSGDSIDFEIIVVDDASSDDTSQILEAISGIRVVRNRENLGFIRSCNVGASESRGKFFYFLNNDTQVLDGWLSNLLSVIQNDETVGAVGSKLIYPDGRLQEAGGIIWQDASGWNYGRLNDPWEPEYNYVREVEYCSGASLLIRRELFQSLGGFSEIFLPAYYEDTDLCFSVRKLGYKVMYQPKSEIVHYEGISSGTDTKRGVKSYQTVNCEKFRLKWQEELSSHFTSSEENVKNIDFVARRLLRKETILIVDTFLPSHDKDAGSLRLFNIIKIFKDLGYSVIFLPDNGQLVEPYTSELQNLGIEVLYCTAKQPTIQEQLEKRLQIINVAWVCRPALCDKYLPILRQKSEIKVVYDTIDLHFLRLKREWELSSDKGKLQELAWRDTQALELRLTQLADLTIVVTEVEKNILGDPENNKIQVIPTIHEPYSGFSKDFQQRSGLLFIGSYNHPPNVDAVRWLCEEIMPLIWKIDPTIKLTLLGSNPPPEVKSLANSKVTVTGYIQDVEPYFLDSRIFVAPLRFGAGIKGKIGHSLSYGLPTVTTPIGSEGMGLTHGLDVMIADNVESFAKCVLDLYDDPDLWSSISDNASNVVRQYTRDSVQLKLVNVIASLL